ncbi:MAG: hypothetical protein IPJ81_13800 [Chitinophagaceae bacterium]|nr:hypothetical protein [Chitinophagaceae bacterium]
MKQEVTKPAKKKLELKKSTITKFVLNDQQLKIMIGGNKTGKGDESCGHGICGGLEN